MDWPAVIDILLSLRLKSAAYEGNGFPWPDVATVDAALRACQFWRNNDRRAPSRIYSCEDRSLRIEWDLKNGLHSITFPLPTGFGVI